MVRGVGCYPTNTRKLSDTSLRYTSSLPSEMLPHACALGLCDAQLTRGSHVIWVWVSLAWVERVWIWLVCTNMHCSSLTDIFNVLQLIYNLQGNAYSIGLYFLVPLQHCQSVGYLAFTNHYLIKGILFFISLPSCSRFGEIEVCSFI